MKNLLMVVGGGAAMWDFIYSQGDHTKVVVGTDERFHIADRPNICSATNPKEIEDFVEALWLDECIGSISNQQFVPKLHFFNISEAQKSEMRVMAEKMVQGASIAYATGSLFGKRIIENSVRNLSVYSRAVMWHMLKPGIGDVILVGAGPSLAKNVELLRDTKAYVIAVDVAVPALTKRGIKPDMVFSIDMETKAICWEGADSSIPMFCSTSSSWDTISQGKKQLILSSTHGVQDAWLTRRLHTPNLRLRSGGSAVTAMFSFAIYMGARSINLVGNDFCWAKESKQYVDGFEPDDIKIETEEVVGIDGKKYQCPPIYNVYRKWLTHVIGVGTMVQDDPGKPARQIIYRNCTEGGALIERMEHVPLSSVIDSLSSDWEPVAYGQQRYDYAGTITFLRKRLEEAKDGVFSRAIDDVMHVAFPRKDQRRPKDMREFAAKLLSLLPPNPAPSVKLAIPSSVLAAK